MSVALGEDVAALVEGGCAAWLATCGRDGVPEATRVMGARVSRSGRSVVLYVPTDQAGLTFDNLRANGRLAVFFVRVTDYRAVQIKGSLASVEPTDEEGRE